MNFLKIYEVSKFTNIIKRVLEKIRKMKVADLLFLPCQ